MRQTSHTLLNTPSVLILYTLLAINLSAACMGAYWLLLGDSPSKVVYQHPLFTKVPVLTREDAKKQEVRSAIAGTTVYRYQEYCLERQALGIVRRQWINGVVYPIPEKRNVGIPGCFSRSFPEKIPSVPVSTPLTFTMRVEYPRDNPIKLVYTEYAPMPLYVNKDRP